MTYVNPANTGYYWFVYEIVYNRPSRDLNPDLRLRRPSGYPNYPTRALAPELTEG